MAEDLTFAIMVDSEEPELIDGLKGFLGKTERVDRYNRYEKNVLTFYRHSFHDPVRALQRDDDSWLYYKYEISVFPVEEVNLESQKKIASALLSALGKRYRAVELVAQFEL